MNKQCIVTYFNPANYYPARTTKTDKDFARKLDFKDVKFPVKIKDIPKIEKKNLIGISVFGYENKKKYSIYVSKKCCEEKYVDLLLIGEEGKGHYVLIKDFNTFMYDHTLHQGKSIFVVMQWLSLLRNFIQQSLNSDSAHFQILLTACQRFVMVRISDTGSGWK